MERTIARWRVPDSGDAYNPRMARSIERRREARRFAPPLEGYGDGPCRARHFRLDGLLCRHRSRTLDLEMGILDDPQDVAERVEHGGDADAAAHVLHALVLPRAQAEEPRQGRVRVGHAPVGRGARGAGLEGGGRRMQPQLEAAHVEADVEGRVEVGRGLEDGAVPG